MADYREPTPVYVEKKSNTGTVIAVIVVLALAIVGLLFATGFWSADVKGGALPEVKMSAEGGKLPSVDLDSKEVVVGTTKQTVTVPKVETQKTTIDVPTVGVKDDKK